MPTKGTRLVSSMARCEALPPVRDASFYISKTMLTGTHHKQSAQRVLRTSEILDDGIMRGEQLGRRKWGGY